MTATRPHAPGHQPRAARAARGDDPPTPRFTQWFSSTPLGARRARQLAVRHLAEWGLPADCRASATLALVIGELAANAATHGRVPARDFELTLRLIPVTCGARRTVRVEVSDTRGERRPPSPGRLRVPHEDAEHGRGLLLVEALADRWEVADRFPVGKTVRAEVDLPA
ncbi:MULTISPECIES: ATP-binding protein [unclassified Streptomyces]|uniref:ATP-binding protein n=1 Tax=unclassified Streptomyces TaxID=2593676 RepID=UPI000CD4E114|nr:MULTISPECIES: ATP-binding protein [unclassified Streptomyces]